MEDKGINIVHHTCNHRLIFSICQSYIDNVKVLFNFDVFFVSCFPCVLVFSAVKLLLDAGADPNLIDEYEPRPLHAKHISALDGSCVTHTTLPCYVNGSRIMCGSYSTYVCVDAIYVQCMP